MSASALDNLIWTLIFAGLIAAVLGLFVGRVDATFGTVLSGGGLVAAAIGVVLVWVRSTYSSKDSR